MRRLMRWAARLYPAAWRARYGDELEILLEDSGSRWTDLLDLMRGALIMQMSGLNFWKIAAAFTLAGALGAGAWSLAIPDRYVSSATLRISDPRAGDGLEVRPLLQKRLQTLQQSAFSRSSLSTIIQRQGLYERERARLPLKDIVQTMRSRDLHTLFLNDSQLTVSFASDDPALAQATVRAIVTALAETNVRVDQPLAVNLEVLEPASLPATPSGPDRPRLIRRGLFAGLALGIVCGGLWTIGRGRRQWRLMGVFAAVGMALGIAIAMLIPDLYISQAVLRTRDESKMQDALKAAFSEASLQAVILKYSLYPSERRSTPMTQIVAKMRNKAIRVTQVEMNGWHTPDTNARAFVVEFAYSDRYKAQAVTRDMVTAITGTMPAEVLDPPSTPQAPSYPNRPQIAVFGVFAGALLGVAASRFRRPTPAAA